MLITSATSQDSLVVYETKAGGISAKSASLLYQHTDTYAQGSGNNQIVEAWSDQRVLANGTNEILDLSGVLKDDFGDLVAFTAIKDIMIENTSATDSLTVGATGANAWAGPMVLGTNVYVIPPKGKMHFTAPLAGWVVTAGTADLLKINNTGAAPITYNISILGA